MRVLIVLEHRFCRTPDGVIWTATSYPYAFWQRYLEVFDEARVVARVADVPEVPETGRRVEGEGVRVWPVPHYLGPWQYALRARAVARSVRSALGPEDAVILRVGSQLANCLWPLLRRQGRPYGVQVVGDPYDIFAPGVTHHPLRRLFRRLQPWELRRQCAHACAAFYVTRETLQRRYPPGPQAVTGGYSDVELPESAFVGAPRPLARREGPWRIVWIGTMAHHYKAPDVHIDALAECVRGGMDLQLTMVGGGILMPQMVSRAAAAGVRDRVHFLGELASGDAVRAQLDAADLFVLASHAEGLPRAMVEATARALPCIGSTVAGIPELLPPEDLVPPGDARALAAKIREVLASPGRMAAMSARNLTKAREYHQDVLHEPRMQLYRHVRRCMEAWLAQRS